jgi:hypothetical protein
VSLTEGSYVDRLTALRALLADRLERAGARDVAAIAKQLADIDARLEELTVPEESDGVDEVAAKRAVRIAEAQARKSS